MDKETIASIQQIIMRGPIQQSTDIPAMLVPNDMEIQSVEHLMEDPYRRRGIFKTNSIDAYVAYTKHEINTAIYTNSATFIDQESMTATTRLDHEIDNTLSSVGWGDHRAQITMKMTPELTALKAIANSSRIDQKMIIDFITDWRQVLRFGYIDNSTDNNAFEPTEMALIHAYQRIRSLKTQAESIGEHKTTDTSQSRSISERSAITSDPPTVMIMRCAPYKGLSAENINVRISYHIAESKPMMSLRIIQWDEMKEKWAESFKSLIQAHDHLKYAFLGTYEDKNISAKKYKSEVSEFLKSEAPY